MKATGFATDEALRAHVEEEHIRPAADPYKFVSDALSEALGLDAHGKVKAANNSAGANGLASGTAAAAAVADSASAVSKQGLTPATPMSRVASMNRQGSSASGASGKMVPGKAAAVAAGQGTTPKPIDGSQLGSGPSIDTDMLSASAGMNDPWEFANIDPHDLSTTFAFAAETAAQGAIADFSVYRTMITPNDTPESKADSGWASEPTSDIPETSHLDLTLDFWTSSEDGANIPAVLDEMQKISIRPLIDDTDTSELAQMYLNDVPSGFGDDGTDMVSMFSTNNVQLDPSLYSYGTA